MKHYVWFIRGEAHRDMAKASIESVAKADPTANRVVMCDDGTDLRPLGDRVDPWKLPANSLPIMVANVEAQCTALMEVANRDEVWFIDTDTLLLRPMPQLHHAMAVTWRTHIAKSKDGVPVIGVAQQMPYNYGVVGARAVGPTREAFIWLRERVAGYNAQYQNWYGNQLALAQLVGPVKAPLGGATTVTRAIPWRGEQISISTLTIDQWPCEQFNYTPEKIDEKIAGKYLLHFKGHSRHLMSDYALTLGLISEPLRVAQPVQEQPQEVAAA